MNSTGWLAVIVLVMTILCPQIVDADTFDHSHRKLTHILQEHVESGLVDYPSLQANSAKLDEYLRGLASVPLKQFQSWTRDQQLAFLINLYNAQTLRLILDYYPVKSIKDIGGLLTKPWDLKIVELFGNVISLDTVEHRMIRKNYEESRIHFAVVCAARGCPALRSEAYQGDKLNEQLEEQAQIFLSDQDKNRIDLEKSVLHISPIFKWYKEDFQVHSRGIASYIGRYFEGEVARRLRTEKFKVRYTDYDWSLNGQ